MAETIANNSLRNERYSPADAQAYTGAFEHDESKRALAL